MNDLPQSRLTPADALAELRADLFARPARSALTALGTLIGIAVLVSSLGLTASLRAQIEGRFDALAVTEVTVTAANDLEPLPADAIARSERLTGVLRSAWLADLGAHTVTGTPVADPLAAPEGAITLYAASPSLAEAVPLSVRGRFFDIWHDDTAAPVAVIGSAAAQRLRIHGVSRQPVIFIDDRPVTVLGIVDAAAGHPSLTQSVVVSRGYAASQWGDLDQASLLVRTQPGSTGIVAQQLPAALRPDLPDQVVVKVPPAPQLTRALISGDTQGLLVALGFISLVIGGVGIANMTLVSVLQRTAEIGLRRALGASRGHIAVQFLGGSTATGLVGGILGTAVGAIVVGAMCLRHGWPMIIPPLVVITAPLVGSVIGFLAGLYPALRASRIEPVDALRSG